MPITTPSLFSTGLQGINQSHALLAQSSERLATGMRINRGADDPAGLIASEHLGGQLSSINSRINAMGRTNLELSIQEGSLSAAAFGIRDLGGLVVQGANAAGLTDAESAAIGTAASGIVQSIGTLTNASGNPILRVRRHWSTRRAVLLHRDKRRSALSNDPTNRCSVRWKKSTSMLRGRSQAFAIRITRKRFRNLSALRSWGRRLCACF